jgi:hypothetical protein
MKRRVYTSRNEKQADFFVGFFITAALIVLGPAAVGALAGGIDIIGWIVPVVALGFLIGAGIYRPWMALGALGCFGTLIALGLLAALFVAVVCSTGFR